MATAASRQHEARITNNGAVASAPQSATQVACPARQRLRLPSDCATKVCTASPIPPSSTMKKNTSQ